MAKRRPRPALRHAPETVRAHRRGLPDFTNKVPLNPGTLLAPLPAVLVGCAEPDGSRPNLITVAWAGIVCSHPPMLTVSIRPERHSHGLVARSGVFTVNLPARPMAEALDRCGVASGRDHDKFALCGLTRQPAITSAAPGVAEAPLTLECRVVRRDDLGSHTMFLAEIVHVGAARALLEAEGRLALERAGLIAFAHGHYYEIGDPIGHFGWSVKQQ